MASIKTEMDCIERLQELTGAVEEMLTFMVEEKLITMDHVKEIKSSFSSAKSFCLTVKRLMNTGALQLVEYEWVILPVERIKVLMVTDRATREFGHNF